MYMTIIKITQLLWLTNLIPFLWISVKISGITNLMHKVIFKT